MAKSWLIDATKATIEEVDIAGSEDLKEALKGGSEAIHISDTLVLWVNDVAKLYPDEYKDGFYFKGILSPFWGNGVLTEWDGDKPKDITLLKQQVKKLITW